MNYHRYYVPDATVFITQVVHARAPVFANHQYIALLRATLHEVQRLHPFVMLAYVFLPDHLHLLIRPAQDCNHSQIMHSFKPNFTKAYKKQIGAEGSMTFWQRRYWDHVIRDEVDFARHLDYIHYNPVKHGVVCKPEAWSGSSFVHWKALGAYDDEWGWNLPPNLHKTDWVGAE